MAHLLPAALSFQQSYGSDSSVGIWPLLVSACSFNLYCWCCLGLSSMCSFSGGLWASTCEKGTHPPPYLPVSYDFKLREWIKVNTYNFTFNPETRNSVVNDLQEQRHFVNENHALLLGSFCCLLRNKAGWISAATPRQVLLPVGWEHKTANTADTPIKGAAWRWGCALHLGQQTSGGHVGLGWGLVIACLKPEPLTQHEVRRLCHCYHSV